MAAIIETSALTKYYGKRRGLAGLDLAVQPGEVYGFLGPNGAGKTTLIRILLDLLRPTSGRATVLGEDPREGGPALRRRIGYLPGDFVVGGAQSARQLLTHLGYLRGGVPTARIEELAHRLDLDLSTRIASLSKGNRQKVAVVQACIGAATGRRSLAFAVVGTVAIGGYLANNLAPAVEGLAWLRDVSPFHYQAGSEPLRNGLHVGDLPVLAGASAVLLLVGGLAFDRRDVAV